MGAWIDPMADDQLKLAVVTKRRIESNLASTPAEPTFQKRFGRAVEMVKTRKPLPPKPPEP